ncbi:MAG: hypothetical protein J5802_01155 [Butyrivibrio sp.]|nr:hypothetical protein [Butyrivibrio sp.]
MRYRNDLNDAGEWDLKNSSALTYDAEKVSDFIEDLRYVNEKYNDKIGMLGTEYDHYRDNQTFVGRAATASKYAIEIKQKGCLHEGVNNIEKAIYDKYCSLDDMFKEIVDPSPKARIDTDVIENVKCDYMRQAETSDIVGRVLENSSRYLEQEFGDLGHVTQINYNGVRAIYEEYNGNGGFLDKCVKRMENYENEALTSVNNSQLDYLVSDLQNDITKAAGGLDDMKTYDPSMAKNSIGIIALSAGITIDPWRKLYEEKDSKDVSIASIPGITSDTKADVTEITKFLNDRGIKVNKRETKDGYFILDKSIADILKEAGVDPNKMDYKDYDDWYITGLKNGNGIVYSMIKVREPMDKKGRTGTSVVFNSMSLDGFKEIVSDSVEGKEINQHTIELTMEDIDSIVHANKTPNRFSPKLVEYFSDPKSEGSYLIADFVIDKVAHDAEFKDGVYELPFDYYDLDGFSGKDELFNLARLRIYDFNTNTITIKDPNNLTQDERNAILLITTGDVDAFAYAGENQFHAVMYNIDPTGKAKSHAIKSDAGVGEAKENDGWTGYEYLFKSDEGIFYLQQQMHHWGEG